MSFRGFRRLFFSLALISALTSTAFSQDWPGWRGPNRDDRSLETGLLKEWPEEGPEKAWTFDNAGFGYAGFAIANGQLFTMGLDGDQEFAICLNAESGEEVWRTPVGEAFENGWGNGPRSTPTVDQGMVYFEFAKGDIACLKVETGETVWQKQLTSLGGEIPFWGYSESPLVVGDLLVVTPGGMNGALAGLNKLSGDLVWQSSDVTSAAHYSSPISMTINDQPQIVQLMANLIVGLDPESGKMLWSTEWHGQTAVIPTPVDVNGKVYVTSGYRAGSRLIEVEPGNSAKIVWDGRAVANHHGGILLVGEHLYGHADKKGLVCQNVSDGEIAWANEDIGKGCLTWADDRFYYVEEDTGKVLLLELSPEKSDVHGEFTMMPQSKQRDPDGRIWVHPVVSNGRLYVRDQEFIHCYTIK